MPRYIAVIACVFITFSSFAYEFEEGNTYYISNEGDDSNDGLSEATPWKTISKINEAFANNNNGGWIAPGDKVLFRRGDTFYGNLYVNRSGTENTIIEISSYGDENLDYPIISGSGGTISGGDYFQAISMVNSSHMLVTKIWVKNDRKDGSRYTYGEYQSFGIKVIANKWGGIVRNITFRDLKVSDVFGITIPPPSDFNELNATGIRFEGEAFEVDKAVAIEDVLIEDCYFTHLGKAGVWSVHKGNVDDEDDAFNRNQNFIIRNNHFYNTGGSGVILSKTNNALVENNDFDHTGFSSETEPRLAGRGSGMWVWRSTNVIAQYNRSFSVRGPNDSHGMHIDFGNKNIVYQYNYSEDSAGGFVEILGENINSVYRFNVSVNDGVREHHGRTLWVSDFAGTGNRVASDQSFIYNNTIYLDNGLSPDLTFVGKNIYVYNNIFQVINGIMGEELKIEIEDGSELLISNNLYDGTINTAFTNLDVNPYSGNPLFENPGNLEKEAYRIQEGSPAINHGLMFPEPSFPNAGTGIFESITEFPIVDAFGEPVNISNGISNIGADNSFNSDLIDSDGDGVFDDEDVCPNTPPNYSVNRSGCIELSNDNFTIEIRGESCPNSANGSITIKSKVAHDYILKINGEKHDFSDEIEIENLASGAIGFCIQLKEDVAFEQCFETFISEGKSLGAKLNYSSNKTIVSINSGTPPFTIFRNGAEIVRTSERHFAIEANFKDQIKVVSKVHCEGEFTENVSGFFTIASNPVKKELQLKLNGTFENGVLKVYDLQGRTLFQSQFQSKHGMIGFELPHQIKNGIYLLQISEGTQTQTTKFILYR